MFYYFIKVNQMPFFLLNTFVIYFETKDSKAIHKRNSQAIAPKLMGRLVQVDLMG